VERWDILDAEGQPTGRLAVRGEPLGAEDRHLIVHVYLLNPEGDFLIQKRSMKKEVWPGIWDVTGGAVLAGEESLQGALREVEEEIGLRLAPQGLTRVVRLKRVDTFVDVWLGRIDAGIDQMTPQEDEVDALRFVGPGELLELVARNEGRDPSYLECVSQAVSGARC